MSVIYSCSSDNSSILETDEESQEKQDLWSMRSKLKNRDVKIIDDLMKKYENMKPSRNTKSGSAGSAENERILKYIEKYIIENENTEEFAEEYTDFEYLGDVNYDEIINDSDLAVEDKEILILTFTHLDIVVKDIENKTGTSVTSSRKECTEQYRTTLTNIRNKYLGVTARAWISFLTGNTRVALMDAAVVLRDAFNGKHYKEIQVADDAYIECCEAATEEMICLPEDETIIKKDDEVEDGEAVEMEETTANVP
jgi:hypothetical protein